MKMNRINKKQLDEYLNIFGKRKMQGLLRDYLLDSTKSWEMLDKSTLLSSNAGWNSPSLKTVTIDCPKSSFKDFAIFSAR